MKIYQAGPLFSDADRAWHRNFKMKLGAAGYEVLWPGDLFSAGEKVTAKQIMEAVLGLSFAVAQYWSRLNCFLWPCSGIFPSKDRIKHVALLRNPNAS